MGKKIPISTSFQLPDGREVIIETGKLATQAHGSVVVRTGNTMIFASVVSSHEAREGQKFFPLSVDYQEKFAAAGRIPGNFFKREARLTDKEILTCRLIDRVIRPLFPDGYMNDTQIIVNLISGEKETLPDALAALAASAALSVSDIPFNGPISEARVARIDGEFVINPQRSDLEKADLEIIVGATIENVMMVEGEAKECDELDLIEAIRVGHEAIKVQCEAQNALAALVGDKALNKRDIVEAPKDEELEAIITAFAKDKILEVAKGQLDKKSRKEAFKTIKDELVEELTNTKGEEYVAEKGALISGYYGKLNKSVIRAMVLEDRIRLDGRKTDEVRPIWVEADYLVSAHGSSIFNRGETQALASLTLGTKLDEQLIDNALNIHHSDFILHYNFPGFSVGEVKPMRGPGRREVGHANLAIRSLKQVMPAKEDNPYTIRILSDVLESNGSSSMATVCAGSLALMDAGIPIKAQVAGIAMGMIAEGDDVAILSDILGDEDALGDMDFKVTGTDKGICACQMDIKVDGLPYEILEKALMQAKEGRLHILGVMNEELSEPNPELKPHAPRITRMEIESTFIGAVIGPGGKIIQEMQKETGTIINIEEVGKKGVVTIAGTNSEGVKNAVAKISAITYVPNIGDEYKAEVKSIMPYGVFVDFMPGRSGFVHISEISHTRIDKIEGVLEVGDTIKVKLIGIDERTGKYRLSRKALIERPAHLGPEPERQDRGPRGGGDRRNRPPRRDNDRRR